MCIRDRQRTETPSEKKQDGIQFSIGFSEHPAFYDRQLNDRYTDLSFALGLSLIHILTRPLRQIRTEKS